VWQQLARVCANAPATQPFNRRRDQRELIQPLQLEQSSCSEQQQQGQKEEEEEVPAEFQPQYESLQGEHTRLLRERVELQQGVSTVRADLDAMLQAIAVQEQQVAQLEQQNAELQSQLAAGSPQLPSGQLCQLIADAAQAIAGSDVCGGGMLAQQPLLSD